MADQGGAIAGVGTGKGEVREWIVRLTSQGHRYFVEVSEEQFMRCVRAHNVELRSVEAMESFEHSPATA